MQIEIVVRITSCTKYLKDGKHFKKNACWNYLNFGYSVRNLKIFKVINIIFNGCLYFDLTDLKTWERSIIAGAFGLIFLMIVSANSFIIYKIYSLKRKTRANLLFAALSISDFFLGIISVPAMVFAIFKFERLIFKFHCKVYRYLLYTRTGII